MEVLEKSVLLSFGMLVFVFYNYSHERFPSLQLFFRDVFCERRGSAEGQDGKERGDRLIPCCFQDPTPHDLLRFLLELDPLPHLVHQSLGEDLLNILLAYP